MCESDGRSSVSERSERRRLVSLASGSSGNALFVQFGEAAGLIDCGIGPNRLRSELLALGIRFSDLAFVYITHEHIDHIRSVPALVKAGVPVVTGRGTAQAMGLSNQWLEMKHSKRFECGNIEITAIRTSHDAAEPLGAVVSLGGVTAAVFTDLGEWDEVTVEAMSGVDVIVVEANHNLDMLKRGPYPAHLKRRVLSPVGHLSNDDCGRLTDVVRYRGGKDPIIYLAHLSETNNTPMLAVADVASAGGWQHEGLTPLPRHGALDLLVNAPCERRTKVELQPRLFDLSTEPGM
jgi:phosphoribosyl 1,2-cyclic phosphodiesterase